MLTLLVRDWVLDHAFMLIPAQALVAKQLESLKAFPPRQKPASFNLENVLATLREGGIASH